MAYKLHVCMFRGYILIHVVEVMMILDHGDELDGLAQGCGNSIANALKLP